MVRVGVLNGTFNNISAFIGGGNQGSRGNHRPVASHYQILSLNVLSNTPRNEWIRISESK